MSHTLAMQRVPLATDAAVQSAVDATEVLHTLYLLGSKDEQDEADSATAFFTGPPQSVALIEAGASAATKVTGVALGAAVPGVWAAVRVFWSGLPAPSQQIVLWGAAIASAAALLALSHLVASDLRARGLAAAATIEARARVAEALLRSDGSSAVPPPRPASALIRVPDGIVAEHIEGVDDPDWTVLALKEGADGKDQLYLVRQDKKMWVSADAVRFH